ncbi:MAG: hypothetical protein ABSF08_11180 [Candidatus Cybelea sp.]
MPHDDEREQPEQPSTPEQPDHDRPAGRGTVNSYDSDPDIPTAWDVAKGYARGFGTDDWVAQGEPVVISGKPYLPRSHPDPTGDTSPDASPLDELAKKFSDPALLEYFRNTSPEEMFNRSLMADVERLGVLDHPTADAGSKESGFELVPWYERPDEQQKLAVTAVSVFLAIAAGAACVIWPGFLTKLIFIFSSGAAVGATVWFLCHLRRANGAIIYGSTGFLTTAFILAFALFRPPTVAGSSAVTSARSAPQATPHFIGGIATAMDVLLPGADHRIVYVTAWVQNDGTRPSKLDLWTITADDAVTGEMLDGRLLKPARPFAAKFNDPKTHLQTIIKYNLRMTPGKTPTQ